MKNRTVKIVTLLISLFLLTACGKEWKKKFEVEDLAVKDGKIVANITNNTSANYDLELVLSVKTSKGEREITCKESIVADSVEKMDCLSLGFSNSDTVKVKEIKYKESEGKIVTEEIKTGTIEGLNFTETDEVTDKVKIQMNDGGIILVDLTNNDAPITIANFQKLVSEKFYDGLIFHRVISGFMIQGGDPTGTGMSGSDEKIKGEFRSNGVTNNLSHKRGVISMARSSDPNSASSQFFICHADATFLDGDYASFGKVIAGMDTVDKIASVSTDSSDRPLAEQKIKTIRFVTVEKA